MFIKSLQIESQESKKEQETQIDQKSVFQRNR